MNARNRPLLLLLAWIASDASWAQPSSLSRPPFEPPPLPAHPWERIHYPDLPVPGETDATFTVLVSSGLLNPQPRLELALLTGAAEVPDVLADMANLEVRLHVADAAAVQGEGLPGWIGTGTWSTAFRFPWSGEALDEAWFELKIGERRYWFEVPYGFVRDPNAPMNPDRRNNPRLARAMRNLPDGDLLVPWVHLTYPNIDIQNGWGLSLKIPNAFDPEIEVILYQPPGGIGQPIQPWSLHDPRLAMRLELRNGRVREARGVEIRLHEAMRRSDTFKFGRYSAEGRDWGRLRVDVDDRTYEWSIPSSLFHYLHGNEDWYRSAKYLQTGDR